MDSFFFIFFTFLLLLHKTKPQTLQSTHLLDLMIRDYTISNSKLNLNTGTTQKFHLPSNFSSIEIETVKLRCGSLRRYGAKIGEFHIGAGVKVEPCPERVLLVKQNLGSNWSSIYTTAYNLTGLNYKLISSVLGLLAYNANPDGVAANPYEVNIIGNDQNPILIDFLSSKPTINPNPNSSVLCACFASNGSLTFKEQVSSYVCRGIRQGHYGLVMKVVSPMVKDDGDGGVVTAEEDGFGKLSRWKVAVGSVIGAGIGAFLIGLLVVAMVVKVKKKALREEMVRRAYEEEALQVSMVGHVTALTASATRTIPRFDHSYKNGNFNNS